MHTSPGSRIHLLLLVSICFTTLYIAGCGSPEIVLDEIGPVEEHTLLEQIFRESEIFDRSLTGFALYDPLADSFLYDRDAVRYFLPASNTKIFTLYGALKTLPDRLPVLHYGVWNDTLFFRGTGDPTFLNPSFDHQEAYHFLENRPEVLLYDDRHYQDEHFGSGWPWDWYSAPYAPEKTPFPIYGNMVRFNTQQVALVMLNEEEPVKPAFFERYLDKLQWNSGRTPLIERKRGENLFLYAPRADTARQERSIPFTYESELLVEMLADTLGREVTWNTDSVPPPLKDTLFVSPADTVYRQLMQISDNFIAEQLMLMISYQQYGRMETARAIDFIREEYMMDLPDEPRWADGSGLSRYNLMTPRSIVTLLEKLIDDYGEEKILSIFPAGGKSGTLSGWYAHPERDEPFVYAKTGTLRNNVTLSGYLFTDSGRMLIFSFLNNNVVTSSHAVRREVQEVLHLVREIY